MSLKLNRMYGFLLKMCLSNEGLVQNTFGRLSLGQNVSCFDIFCVQYAYVGHVCNTNIFRKLAVLSLMLLMQTILLKPKGIERCQILSVRDIVSKHTNSLTRCFKIEVRKEEVKELSIFEVKKYIYFI